VKNLGVRSFAAAQDDKINNMGRQLRIDITG